MQDFEERLKGGHPNSLGNTVEVVEEVLSNHDLFQELFNCYFSNDELVRLRVSSAMKRICKEEEALLIPYIDRLITEISIIDQASAQWTLAQLFTMLEKHLTPSQMMSAKGIVKQNLENHNDWIVLNVSIDTLLKWSKSDDSLRSWMIPHLERHRSDPRKSVASRAQKALKSLQN